MADADGGICNIVRQAGWKTAMPDIRATVVLVHMYKTRDAQSALEILA